MSQCKYKKEILATIDHLRARKSRPDLNRICKHMLKSFRVSPKETKAAIRQCIKDKLVRKVEYKDNVSYRNLTKWGKRRTKELNESSDHSLTEPTMSQSSNRERRAITTAIATLIYHDQRHLENGIPFKELLKEAMSQNSDYSRKQLEVIINKELLSGSLMKLPNGNLALGPADDAEDSSDSYKEYVDNADSNTKTTSSPESSVRSFPVRMRGRPKKNANGPSTSKPTRKTGVRVGERRKMAKKVFDPSDNNVPNKRKRGRPAGSLNKLTIKKLSLQGGMRDREKEGTPMSESQSFDGSEEEQEEIVSESLGGVCSVCHLQKRAHGDSMVDCRECSNKAHLGCLQGNGMLKLRPDNTWLCPHCKTCVVCCETNDAGTLTVCSVCSDAYHALCHSPRIPERLKAWDQWECNNCLESRPTGIISPGIIPNDIHRESPGMEVYMKPYEKDGVVLKDSSIDESIPDVSVWSVSDVYDYFVEHHPEAAPILKEQDVDGQALIMSRREDIVKGLGLPLGPALLLYRIVVKLQTRKDDWTMCWG